MIDHVAVALFLEHPESQLTLFLPCPFVVRGDILQYEDTGSDDWRVNPGRMANNAHGAYSRFWL